jgi:hypothetical protein
VAKSPLEHSFVNKGSKKFSKPVLIIALLGVLGLGGGVLAASITINSGGTIEFGQGTVATIACDTDVTLAPTSTYVSGSSTFLVSSVEIRNIDQRQGTNAGNNGCNGKTLTVKVLNSSGTVLGSIATVVPSATAASATITVTPTPTASVIASDVARLTLESN